MGYMVIGVITTLAQSYNFHLCTMLLLKFDFYVHVPSSTVQSGSALCSSVVFRFFWLIGSKDSIPVG